MHAILTGARPVGALIEVAPAGALSAARPPQRRRGRAERPLRQSRATAQFEGALAEEVSSRARKILLEGEHGSGRLSARRIHELRGQGTTLVVHPAGVAQAQGGPGWLAQLARLLAGTAGTVAVTNLELLDDRTQRGMADLMASQANTSLIVMTCQGQALSAGTRRPTRSATSPCTFRHCGSGVRIRPSCTGYCKPRV